MTINNKNSDRDHIPVDTAYHCANCGHHHCVICGQCHRSGCECKVYRPDSMERYRTKQELKSGRKGY